MSTVPVYSPAEVHDINSQLGPWIVGDYLEVLLQGVVYCQFAHYWSLYRSSDKSALRLVVLGLIFLTTLKSIQSFAQLWIQAIVYFGDLQGAILLNYVKWWQAGNPMMVALVDFYVQLYFCYRLWAISRTLLVVIPILILFVFAVISMVVATIYITTVDNSHLAIWFGLHLSVVFVGDLCLSMATAWFLLRSKKNVLPQTVGSIHALVRLTLQTAAPAAVCALLNLVFSRVKNTGIISTAFNQLLPKLYAVSMMWTLNARRTISVNHTNSKGGPSTGMDHRSGRTRGDEVELGIRVRTHVETITVADFRGADDEEGRKSSPHDRSVDNDNGLQKTAGIM